MKRDRLKRLMAGLFTISVMTTSVFATNGFLAYAETNDLQIDVSRAHSITKGSKTILSSIVDSEANSQLNLLYKSDEEVTIIVELEDKPLIEYYSAEDTSESASSFIASSKAQGINNKLLKGQEQVTKRILKEVPIVVEQEYTVVMNGFSLTAKYGDLDTIKSVKGVKNAFVATVYDLPTQPEVENQPTMVHSTGTIGATEANTSGYTGKGTVVAVVDSGLAINHEAFKNVPEDAKYSTEEIAGIMSNNTMNAKGNVYKSEKIPFAYDYADKDDNPADAGSHGTHVAGTVAANSDIVKGVAPDAQLMIMKVFSSSGGGASDYNILAALDDAVALGVDSINMSLGSPAGFTEEAYEVLNSTYNRVAAAGISLICAAGNEYSSTAKSNLGDLPLVSNPDNGVVGSPSTYNAATSVASINNNKTFSPYFLMGEVKMKYADTNEGNDKAFTSLEGQAMEYVVVPGFGTKEDFNTVDVSGKIALVQRGSTTFTEKENNAKNHNASGLIVYDNVDGALTSMMSDGLLPMIFISKANGEMLVKQESKKISIAKSYIQPFEDNTCGLMSDFSSWGVTADLKLKPEITAPGGGIYSTLSSGGYGSMNGTSMASPHVAGATAVVRQYLRQNEKFKELSSKEQDDLLTNLLMSTATAAIDADGVAYSPRKQGSGLLNVNSAIKTGAYLTASAGKPKAELGDSLTGEYSFNFDINNISDEALTYTVDTTVLTEKILSTEKGKFFAQASEELDDSKITVTVSGEEGNKITVEAGDTKTITVSLKLTEEAKNILKVCENGTFIDGFVTLISNNEDKVNLNIPFLGFYGDWEGIPLFDNDIYDDKTAAMYETALGYFDNSTGKGSYLGVNGFTGKDQPMIADKDKVAIGPKINGSYSVSALVGLLRNTEEVSYSVTDSDGNEIYKNKGRRERKSLYNSNTGKITYAMDNKGWDGINNKNNKPLEDGVYTYKISGMPVGGEAKDLQEIEIPVTIDTEIPELVDAKVEIVDGSKYLAMTLKDNHYLQAMQLEDGKGNTLTKIIPLDKDKPGVEYEEVFKIDGIEAEDIKVIAIDYAKNVLESEPIELVEGLVEPKSVTLNDKDVTLAEGSEFQMNASINPYNSKDKTLTWSSSNEDVATISKTGYVKALAKGETTITVSTVNGKADSTTLTVVNKDELTTELKAPYIIYEDGNYKLPANLSGKTVVIKDTARKVSITGNNENIASNPYNNVDVNCEDNVDLTINNFNTNVASFFKNAIEFKGANNTLTLKGENTLTSTADYSSRASISAAYGTTLEILGKGTLNIKSAQSNYGSCIGGGSSTGVMDSGTINISDGVINATTYGAGAAIGGADSGIASNINIIGGKVTAMAEVKSYVGSAAIGSGASAKNLNDISASIQVAGGEVIASNNGSGAAIGDCYEGNTNYNILISGGHVNAETTSTSSYSAGAAIGAGSSSTGEISINILGGVVDATSISRASAIGGATRSEAGVINIEGGTITATSSNYGAAIGSGYRGKKQNIAILKGTVKATSTGTREAIGKGEDGEDCILTGINGLTPYKAIILAPNVTSVKVDGVDWNIIKGHEGDENIYLYLPEKSEPYRVEVSAENITTMFLVTVKDGNPTVEEIDIIPPGTPSIAEENGLVTLTPADEDTEKMEYSLDNKTWTAYKEPVKVSEKATIYARAIDKAGNISEVGNYTVPDRTAPGVPIIKEEKGLVTLTPADDDTTTIEYSFDGEVWNIYTIPVQVQEKATIHVRAKDEAGNISGVLTYTIPDVTAPVAPVVSEEKGIVTLTAADEDTAKIEYSLDNKIWIVYTKPIELKENETIYARAIDEAGNISGVITYTVVDRTAPAAVLVAEKDGIVTLTAADKDTAKIEYSLDNKTWIAYKEPVKVEEKATIYARAIDESGNVSEVVSYTVPDRTAPKSPVVAEKDGKVTLTAADEDTVKIEYSLDNKTWTIYTEPVKVAERGTIYVRAIDEAGNVSEVSNYTVPDKTAPKSPVVTEKDGLVTLIAADEDTIRIEYSLDSKAWTIYTEPVKVAERGTIYARAIDEAGNVSEVVEYKMSEKPTTEKPEKPENPEKPGNIEKPNNPNKSVNNLPQTGSMVGSCVMALGGVITSAIGALVLKRKK
jgi:subtilisin family serine protease/CRISPR/Cas system-associated protein Cas5 (RAMP superfamily)